MVSISSLSACPLSSFFVLFRVDIFSSFSFHHFNSLCYCYSFLSCVIKFYCCSRNTLTQLHCFKWTAFSNLSDCFPKMNSLFFFINWILYIGSISHRLRSPFHTFNAFAHFCNVFFSLILTIQSNYILSVTIRNKTFQSTLSRKVPQLNEYNNTKINPIPSGKKAIISRHNM